MAAGGLIRSESRPVIPGGGAQSVAELLDAPLAERPDHLALVGRHGRLTYAQLDREVNRAAGALVELGIGLPRG